MYKLRSKRKSQFLIVILQSIKESKWTKIWKVKSNFHRTEGGGGGVARGHWTLNDAEKASQEQEKRILTSMTTLNLDGKKYCMW